MSTWGQSQSVDVNWGTSNLHVAYTISYCLFCDMTSYWNLTSLLSAFCVCGNLFKFHQWCYFFSYVANAIRVYNKLCLILARCMQHTCWYLDYSGKILRFLPRRGNTLHLGFFAEISHRGSTHPLQISPLDAGVGCGPLETENFQKF